jgi:hypothetical protein
MSETNKALVVVCLYAYGIISLWWNEGIIPIIGDGN